MKICLFLIMAIYCHLASSQSPFIQNKWVGFGGTLIYNLQSNHRLEILSIADSARVLKWKLIDNNLVFTDSIKSVTDTFFVKYISNDSLVLDVGKPRGLVIKTFKPSIVSTDRIEKEKATLFLSNGKFDVKNEESENVQVALFYKNGEYVVNGESYKWEVREVDGCLFLLATGRFGETIFSKVISITDTDMRLEVYNSREDISFKLMMMKTGNR